MSEEGWLAALPLGDLADRRAAKVTVEGRDVLLVRDGERLFAIGNRCTHQGAPLHRGPVRFSGSLDTVQCPIHGSMFDLREGKVLRGPAMTPEPAYDARVLDGTIEIRSKD